MNNNEVRPETVEAMAALMNLIGTTDEAAAAVHQLRVDAVRSAPPLSPAEQLLADTRISEVVKGLGDYFEALIKFWKITMTGRDFHEVDSWETLVRGLPPEARAQLEQPEIQIAVPAPASIELAALHGNWW